LRPTSRPTSAPTDGTFNFRHAESPVEPVEQLDEPPAEQPLHRQSPARNPPDEAAVEQSTPSWRVFDTPTAAAGSESPSAAAGAPASDPGGQRLALVGVVAALAIGGLAAVVVLSGSAGGTVVGPDAAFGALGTNGPPVATGEIVVDVTGAVANPGVRHLAAGARVGDAIEAAGGFSPRVDAKRVAAELNLAATLVDGAQVRVPSRDDEPASVGSGSGGSGGAGGSSGGSADLIDLNSATQAELESLPGIGPVTATKIMESRAGAAFRSVDELRERGLVGEKTFEDLRALVTVG
jgi:competence protein ComEA